MVCSALITPPNPLTSLTSAAGLIFLFNPLVLELHSPRRSCTRDCTGHRTEAHNPTERDGVGAEAIAIAFYLDLSRGSVAQVSKQEVGRRRCRQGSVFLESLSQALATALSRGVVRLTPWILLDG